MDRIEVSVAQLLEALSQARPTPADTPDGALTMQEWADALRMDERVARKKIQTLFRAGRVDVYRVPRVGMDGRNYLAPAYRVKGDAVVDAG